MQRAFREAKRWQHDFVGTEHILFGLLCDPDGPAVRLLRSLQIKPDLVLSKVELSLQRHDNGLAMERFPLSPASKRVFQAAAEEAAHFRHHVIGPEHLLLALLRETDCEAAQLLAGSGVAWNDVRDAIARLPVDAYGEGNVHADDARRMPIGDNPSADELERWVAPLTKHAEVTHDQLASMGIVPLHIGLEIQIRLTQFVLGGLLGYTYGHWLQGWMLGLILATLGIGLAGWHNSWVSITVGAALGLFLPPLFLDDVTVPAGPLLFCVIGAFLGSFLGDAWCITTEPVLPDEASKSASE